MLLWNSLGLPYDYFEQTNKTEYLEALNFSYIFLLFFRIKTYVTGKITDKIASKNIISIICHQNSYLDYVFKQLDSHRNFLKLQ